MTILMWGLVVLSALYGLLSLGVLVWALMQTWQ